MVLGHLGINVPDLTTARLYYDELMPLLGFERFVSDEDQFAYRPRSGKPGTYLFVYRAAQPSRTRGTTPASSISRSWSRTARRRLPSRSIGAGDRTNPPTPDARGGGGLAAATSTALVAKPIPATTRPCFLDQAPTPSPDPAIDTLTSREHDDLQQIVAGCSNQEIAANLYLSEATVKSHVGHILTKLALRDRVQAVIYAYEHGLVDAPPRAGHGAHSLAALPIVADPPR